MILDAVPKQVIAGDTWRWTVSFADYPAPTWVVTYYFQNEACSFNSVATADGSDHAVSVAAATTAGRSPGRYRWFARAASGSVVETVADGWIDVLPNPGLGGAIDHRSTARKTLDAVEATLQGRATSDQLSMAINGRALSRIPLPELREWRDQLRTEVKADEGGANAGKSRDLKVTYAKP